MDVPMPGEETPKKKVSLTFMPSKLLNISSIANDEVLEAHTEKEPSSPILQTDDFLTIIPKPTLLGKQQAKKRLQAFSATKQLPIVKKLPEVKKDGDDKRMWKPVKPDDIAKTTIKEIEAIKKLENEKCHQESMNRLYRRKSPKEVVDKNFKYDKHFSISKDSKDSREYKYFEKDRDRDSKYEKREKYYSEKPGKHSNSHSKQSERESDRETKHTDRGAKYFDRDIKHSDRDSKQHSDRHSEKDYKHTEKDTKYSERDARHSSSKHSRHVERERNWEKEKYPSNWKELNYKDFTFEDLKLIELAANKKTNNQQIEKPIDIVRMVKFLLPNYPMVPLKYKKADGQVDIVPPQILRFTMKNGRVPYSENTTRVKNIYFNRNMMFDIISKEHKESMKALIAQSSQSKPVLPGEPLSMRNWFPKTSFSPECEILEQSLGLSILQNCYSEEDEPELPGKTAEVEEEVKMEVTPAKEEEKTKKVKEERKKSKNKSHSGKKRSRSERKKEKKVKKKKKKKQRKVEKKVKKKKKKSKGDAKVKEDVVKSPSEVCELNSVEPEEKMEDSFPEDVPAVDLVGSGTPDTDEYHSHWESDEDLVSGEKVKKENSWESEDEEMSFNRSDDVIEVRPVVKTYNRAERSLEMPLNINISRSRISGKEELPNKGDSPEVYSSKKKGELINKSDKTSDSSKQKSKHNKKRGWSEFDKSSDSESIKKLDSSENAKINLNISNDSSDVNMRSDSVDYKRSSKVNSAHYNESIDLPDFRVKKDSHKKSDYADYNKSIDVSDSSMRSDFSGFNSEIRELVLARKSLSEERRLLEEEKRMIEERGKQIDLRDRSEIDYDENKIIKEESLDEISLESTSVRSRSRKSRWEDASVTVKEEKFMPEPVQNSQSNTSNSWEKVNLLETEYEQFMRAVQSDVKDEDGDGDSQVAGDEEIEEKVVGKSRWDEERTSRKRKVSTTSSSAVSSRSSSSSSASTHSTQLFNNHNICLDDVPLPQPLPVPSPKTDCVVDSTSSPLKKATEPSQIDLENRKPINSIIIAKKHTQLIDNNLFKDSDESDGDKAPVLEEKHSSAAEEKESLEPEKKIIEKTREQKSEDRTSQNSIDDRLSKLEEKMHKSEEKYLNKSEEKYLGKSEEKRLGKSEEKYNRKSGDDYSKKSQDASLRKSDDKRHKSDHVRRSEEKHKGEDKKQSPLSASKRRKSSDRRRSRGRYSSPPPRKHRPESPRRRYRDRERFSPQRSRERSPRKSPQPYRRRSRSPHKETIQETLSRLAGLEPPSRSRSPVDSPLDGFRKSLADSTISDEQLMQNQEHYNSESPRYFANSTQFKNNDSSPKRIPLEERINRVLGIDKEEPKPISTTYAQDYNNYSYYDEYGNYMEQDYESKHYGAYMEQQKQEKEMPHAHTNVSKVVQVGNVLQVVPTEEIPVPINKSVEKEVKVPQKILQVGNMLQIVPVPSLPVEIVANKEVKSAEEVMKQKAAELRAEREKRRVEREKRRKEKEKKRKEREKRRQLKIKQKTEDVIKKALLMDTEGNEEDQEDDIDSKQWLAMSSIINIGNRPAGKSILVRNRSNDISINRKKKGVKFADGIIPGEGTSPSGGEELSSPPPIPFKGIKEKRFTKTKKPKKTKQPKKKIKVKVIKKSLKFNDEEEDNLPPPSPPPGSPPPHLYPPRIKPIPNPTTQNYLQQIPQPPPTQQQQPPHPALNFSFPPGRSNNDHFMQGTPPPTLPGFPPNMTSVPPPNIPLHAPPQILGQPPPQILGQPPPSYPPPPIGMHLPPHLHHHSHPTPGSAHQGQTGRPILVKQSFNSSISPPQHMLGPHNG